MTFTAHVYLLTTSFSSQNTAKELYIWSKCNHPNILPLLGYGHFRDRLVAITLWMPGGCLVDYIQCDPSLDRMKAVSINIVLEVLITDFDKLS
jgi:serine/threonine protein kinase